jgi:glycosyltransferase involved in cell wall biosynthesis
MPWTIDWKLTLFLLFFTVTLLQLLYYWVIFVRLAFYRKKKPARSQQHPVSVIICARDEAGNIAKNLPGVLLQRYPSTHEVIVINHNSQDDTRYLLDEFKKTFKQLTYVNLEQEAIGIPGKKYPLSIGIKESRYEIVLLTDADCVPATENWIERMQEGFAGDTSIVLGYGSYHKLPGLLNKIIRFDTFHTGMQYLSYALAGTPYMGVGRNLSYKKSVFFRNKGFSSINHLPSGDDDLFINQVANADNTSIMIDHDAITLSEPKKKFKEWFRQKKRHFSTARYYRTQHKWMLGVYALSHFLFYPLFISSLILLNWQVSLILFGLRLVSQAIIVYRCMVKLNEKDLFPWFLVMDLWMPFYYLLFSFAPWKKPSRDWN